jgi:hypothetical protein
MAKRSPSASANTPTTTASRPRSVASSEGTPASTARKPKSQSQRSLSAEEIGHVAGDVWACLDRDGTQTIAAVKKAVGAPGDLVVAAIGWLAREDKLDFSGDSRSVKISLR